MQAHGQAERQLEPGVAAAQVRALVQQDVFPLRAGEPGGQVDAGPQKAQHKGRGHTGAGVNASFGLVGKAHPAAQQPIAGQAGRKAKSRAAQPQPDQKGRVGPAQGAGGVKLAVLPDDRRVFKVQPADPARLRPGRNGVFKFRCAAHDCLVVAHQAVGNAGLGEILPHRLQRVEAEGRGEAEWDQKTQQHHRPEQRAHPAGRLEKAQDKVQQRHQHQRHRALKGEGHEDPEDRSPVHFCPSRY